MNDVSLDAPTSQPPQTTPVPHQPRRLGLTSALGICIASMIGSGIFSIPGLIGPALVSPTNVILAWLLGAVLACAGAMVTAELAIQRPQAGSIYVAIRESLGKQIGYVNGLITVFIGYIASTAIVALITAEYISPYLHGVREPLIASGLLVALSSLHATTVWTGNALNNLLVLLKLAIIATLIVAGFTIDVPPIAFVPAPASNAPPLFSTAVGAAVVSINFAYLGWSSVSDVAGEVRRPKETLPRAIVGSVAVVACLYILINLVYMRLIPPAAMLNADGSPMANIGGVVASHLFGDVGGHLMNLAIILILLSTLSTNLFVGGRTILAMAHQGELPRWQTTTNARGAPSVAIGTQACFAIMLVCIAPVQTLLNYTGFVVTACAALSGFALLVFRRRGVAPSHRMPLHPIPVSIFLGLSGYLLITATLDDWTTSVYSVLTVLAVMGARRWLTSTPTSETRT